MNLKKELNLIIKSSRGFSLIEILIALTLLGIAGTFVAGKIFESLHEGKVKSTRIQMSGLEGRLKEFRRKCGFYPTTEQSLEALVSKPTTGRECRDYPSSGFIDGDQVPQDPWNNNFGYESDGLKYNMWSFGNDGVEGGEGEDKDIFLKEKQGASEEAAEE